MARKRTTIFDAIATGDPARVKRHLTRKPDALEERDGEGRTPLMRALYEGHRDVAAALIERGAFVGAHEATALGDVDALRGAIGRSRKRANELSADGFAPLHLAAFFGQLEAARLLVEKGADLHARSTNRRLPSVTPLHSAAAARHTAVAELLLEAGADPNVAQNGGWTALHSAAANGNAELARLLLARGAEPMAMADDRTRPIDFAIENRFKDVVELLRPYLPAPR